MSRYRNVGGPHRQSDGSRVMPGDTFEPTDRELESFGDKFEAVGDSAPISGADIGVRSLPMTDAALQLALDHGLGEEDFADVEPEGASGDYLKSQVEALIAEGG